MKPFTQDIVDGEVRELLLHFNWRQTAVVEGLYEVWAEPGNRNDEVLVPLDQAKSDYAMLLSRALSSLTHHYGSDVLEFAATLRMRLSAGLRPILWKKDTALDAGVIGLDQGAELYQSARTQLIASAKSAREARRYHGPASAYIGRTFIESALMGQTDIGSFIITAYTPAQQRFFTSQGVATQATTEKHGLWKSAGTLSGNDILDTFERGLKAARAGLDQYRRTPRAEIFLDAVPDGLSNEFTKALSLIVSGGNASVEIGPEELTPARRSRSIFEFEAAEAPILEEVANVFAQDDEPRHVSLVGEVTLLSRSHSENNRVIRLSVHSGAEINKARVRLTPEQYEKAMDAHRSEADVRVTGRLEREGQYFWLYDATELEIVPVQRIRPTVVRPVKYDIFGEVEDDDE